MRGFTDASGGSEPLIEEDILPDCGHGIKVQTMDALQDWIRRTEKLAGREDLPYFVEYKFDGLTLNLTYREEEAEAGNKRQWRSGRGYLPGGSDSARCSIDHSYQGSAEVQGECIMRLSAGAV